MNDTAKAYGLLGLVFVLGALAGGGVGFAVFQGDYRSYVADEVGQHREKRRLSALTKKLNLKPSQKEAIGQIVAAGRKDRRELNQEMLAECGGPLRAAQQTLNESIRALLDPAQRQRFDALNAQGKLWSPHPKRHKRNKKKRQKHRDKHREREQR